MGLRLLARRPATVCRDEIKGLITCSGEVAESTGKLPPGLFYLLASLTPMGSGGKSSAGAFLIGSAFFSVSVSNRTERAVAYTAELEAGHLYRLGSALEVVSYTT